MKHYLKKLTDTLLNGERPAVAVDDSPKVIPVIWLLGKTGAGKTSLIRTLTGLKDAEIGNGFEPCTRTAREFEFPVDMPLVQFLDTRGLGEVDYDPSEDLKHCQATSHIVLVLARLDDPVQHEIAAVLKDVSAKAPNTPILLVHTGADLLRGGELERARSANQRLLEKATGKELVSLEVAMPAGESEHATGIDILIEHIAETLPEVALLLMRDNADDEEAKAFSQQRPTAIRYASAAATADLVPVVGAALVPSTQAVMLRELARAYDVTWSKKRLSEFTAALGAAALARFGGSYFSRQLAKLIPAYGQTLGAMTAGAISFAATYALARSASYYLFHIKYGKHVNAQELRALYKNALAETADTFKRSREK